MAQKKLKKQQQQVKHQQNEAVLNKYAKLMKERKEMKTDQQQQSLFEEKESNDLQKSETNDTVVLDSDAEDFFDSPTRTDNSKNGF